MFKPTLFNLRAATLLSCVVGGLSLSAAEPNATQVQFFEAKIRPILANKCYSCHSAAEGKSKGGLFLDTAEATLKGGNTGPAVAPGNPDKSLLIQAVRYTDADLQMPPKNKKLSDAEIADLTTWVKMGAPDPRKSAPVVNTAKRSAEKSDHWAFQPLVKPVIPEVKDTTFVFNPIDSFVVAQLENKGIKPSPTADKRLLIRRATFDLIGLPPTPEEVEDFVKDTSSNAFEKVINRLLDSPQYGERWGRFWLDSARYSDTKGEVKKKKDTPDYPFAWTYRDYVIKAFNEDKPYNQFIMEQIAADRLGKGSKDNSNLAALGFLTIGQRFMGNKNDVIDDRIDVVSKAFLGLTVACARCHDHKFDPIPTADYYSLYGIFASSMEPENLPVIGKQGTPEQYQDYVKQWAPIQKELQELEQFTDKDKRKGKAKTAAKPVMTKKEMAEKVVRLKRQLNELDESHPGAPVRAMVLVDSPKAADAAILIRGEAQSPGQVVPRRFLEVLSGPERPTFQNGSGRLELAQAIASPKNPLTPRVMMNRVWQHHFGEGIVATPDDFGNQATPPTHPELLDYLATEFVKQGWSVKAMHRLIMLSHTYQQSSANNPTYAQMDPFNKLLWRANIRRLDFEAVRDSVLAIGGSLDLTQYGNPVELTKEPFITRRTVYGYIDRADLPEMFNHFDFANPDMTNGKRNETIVPQQSLFMMNSPIVVEQARNLVELSEFEALKTDDERITFLYDRILQRPPSSTELRLSQRFVSSSPAVLEKPEAVATSPAARQKKGKAKGKGARVTTVQRNREPLTVWAEYAHALFMSNEATFLN
jgi:cytochrome c553